LSSLLAYSRRVDYRWILASLVVLALAYVVRSLRWQLLLRPVGRIPLCTAYHSIIISFMINCVFPGRMGEIARPLILKRKTGLAFTSSLATLAAERLLDLAVLLALFFMALLNICVAAAPPVIFGQHILSADLLMHLTRTSATGLVLLVAGLIVIANKGMRRWLVIFLECLTDAAGRMFPRAHGSVQAVNQYCQTLLEHFAHGLQFLKSPGNLLTATLLSMLAWLLIALSFFLVACGSPGIELGFADTIFMMVIICFFIALPSVPGYWGLWEAAGVFALHFFGIAKEQATGFSLLNHAIQILPLIPAGWISCLLLGYSWSDIINQDRHNGPRAD
jgi:uncharacterized protein (TIRG00374 family)